MHVGALRICIATACSLLLLTVARVGETSDRLLVYVGKYPHGDPDSAALSVLRDSELRGELAGFVPGRILRAIDQSLTVGSLNSLVDGFLVVSGCQPHNCPGRSYILMVPVSDGAPSVIFFSTQDGQKATLRAECFTSGSFEFTDMSSRIKQELLERSPNALRWIETLSCPGSLQVTSQAS